MTIVVAIVLGFAGLCFVLYPLYRPALAGISLTRISNDRKIAPRGMSEREQAARNALQEVELDYQLGNISDEDYNTLRERYMRRALVALKSRHEQSRDALQEIHEHSENAEETSYDQDIDELIEEELRRLRQQKQERATDDEIKENKGDDASE